jgi:hypothetical protein
VRGDGVSGCQKGVLTGQLAALSQLLYPDDIRRFHLEPPPSGGKSFHDMYLDVSCHCRHVVAHTGRRTLLECCVVILKQLGGSPCST